MGRANDQRGGAGGSSSLEAADVSTGLSQLGISLDADAIERIRRLGGTESLQAMARVGLRKDPAAVPPPALQPPTTQLTMGSHGRPDAAPPMAGNSSTRINSNASVTSTTFTNANRASTLSLSAISQSGVPLLAWGGVGDGSTVDTRDPIGSSHKDPLWRIPKKGKKPVNVTDVHRCDELTGAASTLATYNADHLLGDHNGRRHFEEQRVVMSPERMSQRNGGGQTTAFPDPGAAASLDDDTDVGGGANYGSIAGGEKSAGTPVVKASDALAYAAYVQDANRSEANPPPAQNELSLNVNLDSQMMAATDGAAGAASVEGGDGGGGRESREKLAGVGSGLDFNVNQMARSYFNVTEPYLLEPEVASHRGKGKTTGKFRSPYQSHFTIGYDPAAPNGNDAARASQPAHERRHNPQQLGSESDGREARTERLHPGSSVRDSGRGFGGYADYGGDPIFFQCGRMRKFDKACTTANSQGVKTRLHDGDANATANGIVNGYASAGQQISDADTLPSNPNPNGSALEIDTIPRRARPNVNARGYGPAYASAVQSNIHHFHSSPRKRAPAPAPAPADATDASLSSNAHTNTEGAGVVENGPAPTGLATVERRPVDGRYHYQPPPRSAWTEEQMVRTRNTDQAHGHVVNNTWKKEMVNDTYRSDMRAMLSHPSKEPPAKNQANQDLFAGMSSEERRNAPLSKTPWYGRRAPPTTSLW